MIVLLALSMSAALSLLTFARWRLCILTMTVMTVAQDPLRKLAPGAPGYFALLTAPILLAAVAGLVTSRRGWWTEFRRAQPAAARGFGYLALACIPAAMISATYGAGSWIYTLLGVASYGTVLMSMVLGFHLLRSESELRRVLAVYCLITVVMLSGGWLQYSGAFEGWRILGSDALGMNWIRYRDGYIVDLIGGFYRTPDVMGWHAAACTMLALLLGMTSRGWRRLMWLVVAIAAAGALLICGRRKMVFMLPLFVLAVLWMYYQSGRAGRIVSLVGLLLLPLAGVLVFVDYLGGEQSAFLRYYSEGSLETFDRIEDHGFGAVLGTLKQTGFFGGGLGFATPGAHQLPIPHPRTWQESGPSRIMFELGVPGLVAFAALIGVLIAGAWRSTQAVLRRRARSAPYAVGMFGFFLCNAGSLVVSGQILGDPFIAAFIGLSLGMVLAFDVRSKRPLPDHRTLEYPVRGGLPGRPLTSLPR